MAQVDSENSTALPAVSTRRSFLSQAAGVAATGTAIALAALPERAAADPVFALIETHKATEAALDIAIAEKGRLNPLAIGTLTAAPRPPTKPTGPPWPT